VHSRIPGVDRGHFAPDNFTAEQISLTFDRILRTDDQMRSTNGKGDRQSSVAPFYICDRGKKSNDDRPIRW
jgi:hypothetical protein